MSWFQLIIVSICIQTLLINNVNGNAIRRRRQQPMSGSMYGGSSSGMNQGVGYNFPSNINPYGNNLNNQGSKDSLANSMMPQNTGNAMNNMGLYNPQHQQQQQPSFYGHNNQPSSNPSYGNSAGFYSGSGTNQVLRDTNTNMGIRDGSSNLPPAGPSGSSLFPSANSQLGFPPNANQNLNNKDPFNAPSNTNNNPYSYNNNAYPNANTFSGQMGMGNNNVPWPTANNNNPFSHNNMNAGNSYYQNRDLSGSNNNNNAPYSNPNAPYFYNHGHCSMMSWFIVFLSFIVSSVFHI